MSRGGGKERGRVGKRFQISMKSELRLSDSLVLPLLCSDDGGSCVTFTHTFDQEQDSNTRGRGLGRAAPHTEHGLMRFVPRARRRRRERAEEEAVNIRSRLLWRHRAA